MLLREWRDLGAIPRGTVASEKCPLPVTSGVQCDSPSPGDTPQEHPKEPEFSVPDLVPRCASPGPPHCPLSLCLLLWKMGLWQRPPCVRGALLAPNGSTSGVPAGGLRTTARARYKPLARPSQAACFFPLFCYFEKFQTARGISRIVRGTPLALHLDHRLTLHSCVLPLAHSQVFSEPSERMSGVGVTLAPLGTSASVPRPLAPGTELPGGPSPADRPRSNPPRAPAMTFTVGYFLSAWVVFLFVFFFL